MGQLSSLVNIVRLFNEAVEEIRDDGLSTYVAPRFDPAQLPSARAAFGRRESGDICNQIHFLLTALHKTGYIEASDFRHMQKPQPHYPDRYLFTLKTPDFAERTATRSRNYEGDFKIYLSCFNDGQHSIQIHGANDRATKGLRAYLVAFDRSRENPLHDIIVLNRRGLGGQPQKFRSLEDPVAAQMLKETARILVYGSRSLSLFCESKRERGSGSPDHPNP